MHNCLKCECTDCVEVVVFYQVEQYEFAYSLTKLRIAIFFSHEIIEITWINKYPFSKSNEHWSEKKKKLENINENSYWKLNFDIFFVALNIFKIIYSIDFYFAFKMQIYAVNIFWWVGNNKLVRQVSKHDNVFSVKEKKWKQFSFSWQSDSKKNWGREVSMVFFFYQNSWEWYLMSEICLEKLLLSTWTFVQKQHSLLNYHPTRYRVYVRRNNGKFTCDCAY